MVEDSLTLAREAHIETILARSANFLHQVYLLFRERTWWLHIAQITDDGSEVVAHGCRSDIKPFVPFNNDLIHNLNNSDSVRAAVLTYNMCDQAFVRMEELFKQLVQGIESEIVYSEVRTVLKDSPPRTTTIASAPDVANHGRVVRESNWPCDHDVLLVRSVRGNMSWCIDLTFEQYGLERGFWLAKDYEDKYVKSATFREINANRKDLNKENWGPLLDEAEMQLNVAVNKWVKDSNVTLATLIEREEVFEEHKGSLLEAMDKALKAFTANATFSDT